MYLCAFACMCMFLYVHTLKNLLLILLITYAFNKLKHKIYIFIINIYHLYNYSCQFKPDIMVAQVMDGLPIHQSMMKEITYFIQ